VAEVFPEPHTIAMTPAPEPAHPSPAAFPSAPEPVAPVIKQDPDAETAKFAANQPPPAPVPPVEPPSPPAPAPLPDSPPPLPVTMTKAPPAEPAAAPAPPPAVPTIDPPPPITPVPPPPPEAPKPAEPPSFKPVSLTVPTPPPAPAPPEPPAPPAKPEPISAAPAEPHAAPPFPWRLALEFVGGQTQVEVRRSDELLMKVQCEKFDLRTPGGGFQAAGKVVVSGPCVEARCDRLMIAWATGQVALDGSVSLSFQNRGTVQVMRAESLTFRLTGANAPVDFTAREVQQLVAPPAH
jgi:hypothetical protein